MQESFVVYSMVDKATQAARRGARHVSLAVGLGVVTAAGSSWPPPSVDVGDAGAAPSALSAPSPAPSIPAIRRFCSERRSCTSCFSSTPFLSLSSREKICSIRVMSYLPIRPSRSLQSTSERS